MLLFPIVQPVFGTSCNIHAEEAPAAPSYMSSQLVCPLLVGCSTSSVPMLLGSICTGATCKKTQKHHLLSSSQQFQLHPPASSSRRRPQTIFSFLRASLRCDTESMCECSCYWANVVRVNRSHCAPTVPSVGRLEPAGGSASPGTPPNRSALVWVRG